MRHREQRVLVLFDVQNLYYSAKHLYNTKVNFKAILEEAVAKRRLIRAIAYVIKTEIKEESNFHDALNKIGIEVKQKDLQVFYGGAKKGDWDIGIAMDAVRMVSKIDNLVLVSGDGDFKDLLAYMKSNGVRCEVMALGKTSSKHLKEEADLFIDIEKDLDRYLIGRRSKGQRKPHDKNHDRNHQKPQSKPQRPRPVRKPAEKVVVNEKRVLAAPKIAPSKSNGFVMPEYTNLEDMPDDDPEPVKKHEIKKESTVKKTVKKTKKVVKKAPSKPAPKKDEKKIEKKAADKPEKAASADEGKKKGFASKLKQMLSK